MTIRVEKYKGDYSDLAHLEIEGRTLLVIASELSAWDVYVGYEDDFPRGYFILSRESKTFVELNPFSSLPFVMYLANTGSTELREALLAKIKETVRSRKQQFFIALNYMGMEDSKWQALFATAGNSTRLGSVFQFDVGIDVN